MYADRRTDHRAARLLLPAPGWNRLGDKRRSRRTAGNGRYSRARSVARRIRSFARPVRRDVHRVDDILDGNNHSHDKTVCVRTPVNAQTIRAGEDRIAPEPRVRQPPGVSRGDDVLVLQAQQHPKSLADVRQDVARSLRFKGNMPSVPIEGLHVVGQNNTRDPAASRQRDLERVSLHMTRDRARDGEPCFCIVGARREDQGRPSTALLMSGLRIECQPH
jgi:hypothetical protein